MAVLAPAFGECPAVRLVGVGPIELAALAIAGRPVALQVADVGIGRPAAHLQPGDSRLDDDTAHALAPRALTGRELQPIGYRLASADPTAPSLPGTASDGSTPLSTKLRWSKQSPIGLGGRGHELGHEGRGPIAGKGGGVW